MTRSVFRKPYLLSACKPATVHRTGFDLRLMSSLNDVSGIPTEGKNLIIVAAVNNVLRFRIFAGDGKVVVDTDEKSLTEQARQIEDLREQLSSVTPSLRTASDGKVHTITAQLAVEPGKTSRPSSLPPVGNGPPAASR